MVRCGGRRGSDYMCSPINGCDGVVIRITIPFPFYPSMATNGGTSSYQY